MMPDKNPCKMEDESPMDSPENRKETFTPPTDMTDISFIKLAEKMKKLSPETLDSIRKDLQPDTTDEEPSDKEESATPTTDVKVVKVEAQDMSPADLIIGIKKVLGYTK